jgi:hypothetical protein
MMSLEEIRKSPDITSEIDWEMTPEEAVTLYLEWGNSWSHGKHLIRSKSDRSLYFVVNTWEDPARITLIRRNSEEAVELAMIELSATLRDTFLESVGHLKGVYPLNTEIRAWLERRLYTASGGD